MRHGHVGEERNNGLAGVTIASAMTDFDPGGVFLYGNNKKEM
jgi:hypothetical protein